MRRLINKRGLSPVIATVLLISIALILAVIIFLWARSFVSEKVQKFSAPIENACPDISFEAEADVAQSKINVVNRGTVALYGIEVRKVSAGTVEGALSFPDSTIADGETSSVTVANINEGDELLIVPIILGEAKGSKKAYTCDEKYGYPITYTA